MKLLTKYILPAALVAGFLFYFFSDAFNRHFSLDDCFYDGLVRKYGIGESIDVCYKLANGRWFSHIICAFSFYIIGQSFFLYGVYLTFLLALFVYAVSSFYKNYYASFLKQNISLFSRMSFSLVFTSTLYFLLFEGRWETWSWVSSANTHLLSVIVCLFLFSLLVKESQTIFSVISIFMLSVFIGGLNEVNAICTVFSIIGLFLLNRFYFPDIRLGKLNMLVSILAIIASLLINIYSGGYKLRMEGLPDFNIMQSFKNTAHSFLMPVLHYRFLSVYLGVLLVFVLFLKEHPAQISKKILVVFLSGLTIVALSFFLHCYMLSDVVPARGAIWGYCFMLFIFSLFFLSDKKNST